jgi:hypothetical protein
MRDFFHRTWLRRANRCGARAIGTPSRQSNQRCNRQLPGESHEKTQHTRNMRI